MDDGEQMGNPEGSSRGEMGRGRIAIFFFFLSSGNKGDGSLEWGKSRGIGQ